MESDYFDNWLSIIETVESRVSGVAGDKKPILIGYYYKNVHINLIYIQPIL